MARVRMKDGAVTIPQSVREAHGLEDGAEFEVIDGGLEIRLRMVEITITDKPAAKKLTAQEFLDSIPRYEGPRVDISRELIKESVISEAARRWDRVKRQRDEDESD